MKSIKVILSLSTVLCVLLLTNCHKDDIPASEQMLKKMMAKSWSVKTVSIDNTDATSSFAGMTLNFTATNYTTTNGGVVWPASGTWVFTDDTATQLKRNDDLVITIEEATGTSLKLSFSWAKTTFGPGRVGSVAGTHVFTFQ